jgi:hypothetical protein
LPVSSPDIVHVFVHVFTARFLHACVATMPRMIRITVFTSHAPTFESAHAKWVAAV